MIAVLLPTYNQPAFLPEALAGLGRQTCRDFEVIACDDGSDHLTKAILRGSGLRVVTHPKNLGTAAAINSAAELVKSGTRYMTWVSSDNVMHPDWLETLLSNTDARTGAVYSAYNRVENGGVHCVRQGPYDPSALIRSDNCYFGPSFLIRHEVWQTHRGNSSHDFDNWSRVEEACWAADLSIRYVDRVLCDYRAGPWCTARARPELFDAPKWRAEAIKRRQLCALPS